MHRLPRMVHVEYRHDYVVFVRFADGAEGEVDLAEELTGEVFEPLRDRKAFRRCYLHPELHTLTWPNGADLAPEFLYDKCHVPAS